MNLKRFIAGQLRKPSGWFGSVVLTRMFDAGNRRLIELGVERLELGHEDRVLDIGFGAGHSLVKLAGMARQGAVIGLDFSPEMVRFATGRIGRKGLASRISIVLGDAASLPFHAAAFDRVFTANTIYFWPDVGAGMREIARVTKPGGRLAIALRSKECMQRAGNQWHGFTLYDPEEVAALMQAACFRVVTLDHEDKARKFDTVVVVGDRV